jgi:FkbM family methyltransferase
MAQRRKTAKTRTREKSVPQVTPAAAQASVTDAVREATRLHVAGKLAEALPFYERAAKQQRTPALLNNYGAALRDLKRSAEAVPLFREAAEKDTVYADARLNLGLSLLDIGALDEAEAALERAREMLPPPAAGKPVDSRTLQAIGGLAAVLRGRQRFDEMIALYQRAVEQAPDNATLQCQIGSVYFDLNRLPEAVAAFEAALRIDPDFVAAQGNLGTAYSTLGRAEEAVACQRRTIELEPDNPKHYVNLGAALKAQGLLGEAAEAYRKAAALKPDYDYAVNNLGNLLREQGELKEAVACFRRAIEISPEYLTAFSNLLFTLNSLSDLSPAEIYAEHRRFGEKVEAKAPPPAPHANRPDPAKRLRIGYLSPDFLGHSVAYFVENLLEHHDRSQVEVVCYALNKRADSLSRRLQARTDVWRSCSFLSDDELAALIRADGIDILVDLAGHTAENRLTMMAHRPAPVQVTYCGYPNTTGLKTIDYRLTDALVDPPGESDATHSETLVRLPRSFLCYRPSDFAGEVAPRPVSANGYVTFGSFNVLAKMTETVVAAWSQILKQVPKSRLLLKCNAFTDPNTAALYRRRFADHGIAESRIDLMGRQPLIGDHLAMYGKVDIALDPFPYNGTTTTCEALHMGVPMVAMRGDRHVGRVSAALMHHVGLDDLVAESTPDYVAIAVALARDPARIQRLSAGLRPAFAASPLMDAPGFTREVEAAYRAMWRNWCAGRTPAAAAPVDSESAADAEVVRGTTLFERGDSAAAEAAFRKALTHQPNHAHATMNLGTALKRQRRITESLEYFKRAVEIRPDWASAHSNLASAYCDLGQLDLAEAACRRAIELDPKNRNAHSNLASVYAARRRDEEAVPLFRKALEIGPPTAELYVNLSAACISSGWLEEAVEACQDAIKLQPNLAEAHANLASALAAQGKLHQSIAAAREVVKLKPDLHLAWSNLLFSLNYADNLTPEAVAREHRDWGARLAGLAARDHENSREPQRRLRVGFISADFCAHSCAFFLKPLFDRHDAGAIEIFCYSDVVNPDLYTDFLKAKAAHWRTTVGLEDARVAAMVREDKIDILIDLAGHTSKNRLGVFARKPAPVQATWLGYPNSTGLPAIDWRLVDAVTDPEGVADSLAVERLLRLPQPFLCYEAAPKTPEVEVLPALRNGHVTFGCFNKINKISDRTVRLWARVLAAVPDSRMILKSLSFNDAPTRDRLLGIMAEAGIAADRVSLLGWEPLLKDHLSVYHRIDIALDTVPYNGTTTTCEAAWMGVPTVVLNGDRHAARVGASINTALGLPQLIGADEGGYVAAAQRLAADVEALAALRAGLRARMQSSPLCDARGFAAKFEAAVRLMWSDWCGHPAGAAADLRLRIAGGVEIIVPNDLSLISPHVLLEQEDWFEDEAPFVRGLLQPGDRMLDIGANYGVYTLTGARAIGPQGRVWSFEPAQRTADYLARSIAANGFGQVTLVRAGLSNREGTAAFSVGAQSELNSLHATTADSHAETIALTTLDRWAAENGWPAVDFVKLDAEGEEPNVVRGGEAFLERASPLIMFEVKHGTTLNFALKEQFEALGYRAYRLVPGLSLLRPFVAEDAGEPFLLNLFCCKPDRAAQLARRGLLCEAAAELDPGTLSPDAWRAGLGKLAYAQGRVESWAAPMRGAKDYALALAAYLRARDATLAPGVRLAALDFAFRTLKPLVEARWEFGRALSLVRIATDLGHRGLATAVLRRMVERELPDDGIAHLAPSARYEVVAPGNDLAAWRRAALLETLTKVAAYAGIFSESGTADLDALCATGYQSAEAERRRILMRARKGASPVRVLPRILRERSAENLNPEYWIARMPDPKPAKPATSLLELLPDFGKVNIVDIGAMSLGEREPYRPLITAGRASVVGFEPNETECAKLNQGAGAGRYYPYFVGDGSVRTFHETNQPMTGSLYEPNTPLLEKFAVLAELVTPVARHGGIQTRRLDDLAGLEGLEDIDLIKIDIQGGELDVFRAASRALDQAVIIITEVEFIELYKDQPLFGDIDRYLRGHGFQFHTFLGFGKRFFKPFIAPGNAGAGFHQMLWSDAVFVKDFMNLDRLPDTKLLKMAAILDATLGSHDLAAVALQEYDRRHGTSFSADYVSMILGRHAAARAKAS